MNIVKIMIIVIIIPSNCTKSQVTDERISALNEKLNTLLLTLKSYIKDGEELRQENKKLVYEMETTMKRNQHEVTSEVRNLWLLLSGLRFVGYGVNSADEEHVVVYDTTLGGCMDVCVDKRRREGEGWNGVVWRITDGVCWCIKKDQGHNSNNRYGKKYRHYRFQ